MEQKNNLRQLYLLQYLYSQTDDEHPATTADITSFLAEKGIAVNRHTIASDIEQLCAFGFDIITNRSRQNKYFIGSRRFELAELKMIVDAVQAARFISADKSAKLIEKLAGLTSVHRAESLNRQLYTAGRVKSTNEHILYTVDLLYSAITFKKQVTFKYLEYNPKELCRNN